MHWSLVIPVLALMILIVEKATCGCGCASCGGKAAAGTHLGKSTGPGWRPRAVQGGQFKSLDPNSCPVCIIGTTILRGGQEVHLFGGHVASN